jgi:hypothetical protein
MIRQARRRADALPTAQKREILEQRARRERPKIEL